jgi:hypothetical protein
MNLYARFAFIVIAAIQSLALAAVASDAYAVPCARHLPSVIVGSIGQHGDFMDVVLRNEGIKDVTFPGKSSEGGGFEIHPFAVHLEYGEDDGLFKDVPTSFEHPLGFGDSLVVSPQASAKVSVFIGHFTNGPVNYLVSFEDSTGACVVSLPIRM